MKTVTTLASWVAIAGITWSFGLLYNVYGGGKPTWLRGMYEKKIELSEQIQEPKLIVTGGSGAHYTINSDVLEKSLNVPVVNLGIDGPVGLNVILPSILPQVRAGDTVLLIPEYLLLHHENGLGERSGSFAISTKQPFVGEIPPGQLLEDLLALGIPSLRSLIKSSTDIATLGKVTGYYDDPLTENGDPTIEKVRVSEWWKLKIDRPATPHTLAKIAEFNEQVEARGGTLILALPWIYGDPNHEKTIQNVRQIAKDLAEIAPILYSSENLNVQDNVELFSDTHYHLKPEARILRSQQLSEEIQAYF